MQRISTANPLPLLLSSLSQLRWCSSHMQDLAAYAGLFCIAVIYTLGFSYKELIGSVISLRGTLVSVRWLVCRLVGWSVCPKRAGSYTSMLLSEHFLTTTLTYIYRLLAVKFPSKADHRLFYSSFSSSSLHHQSGAFCDEWCWVVTSQLLPTKKRLSAAVAATTAARLTGQAVWRGWRGWSWGRGGKGGWAGWRAASCRSCGLSSAAGSAA